MEFTKLSPIKRDVKITPGSTIICEFKVKGTKEPIKLNVTLNMYCKNPTYPNMIGAIVSDVQSVYTSKDSTIHKVEIKVPEFKSCNQSFVTIQIDNSASVYEKVYLEHMNVDIHHLSQPVKLQQIVESPQRAPSKQSSLRQSLANQLMTNTVMPNTRSKTRSSAPVDIFAQRTLGQCKHAENLKIQDVQPRKLGIGEHKEDQQMQDIQARLPEIFSSLSTEPKIVHDDKIIFVSTFGTKCGIATYTMHLMNDLNNISNDSFTVCPTNEGSLNRKISGKLIHIQHEFGIIPTFPRTDSKVIITWHTVSHRMNSMINRLESELNIVAYIVHCQGALDHIKTKKDRYVINHGSSQIKEMKKTEARKILNINNIDIPIGFVFGFQSPNKLYGELINTAKQANIHVIISASSHGSKYIKGLTNDKNVTFLNRHLTEEAIDLYASASDILLFDYMDQNHYSSSGAMHRIIGTGRPVICSNIKHFSDVTDKKDVLKFNNQKELLQCITTALADSERLGKAAREYAETTSWENIAKKHIEIYRKYVSL